MQTLPTGGVKEKPMQVEMVGEARGRRPAARGLKGGSAALTGQSAAAITHSKLPKSDRRLPRGPRAAARGLAGAQLVLFSRRESPADVDVHAYSRPARAFTGDFYFTHRHGSRLWFALGDVAGKGINAAVVMAMIQEELEQRITSCARAACDPSTTMTRLHTFLRPLLPQNRFATTVIGNLDDDGTLTIVNGGHCAPLIVRRDGSIDAIGSTGPVVGILPSARWHSTKTHLERSETLVLYSDGLLEAKSPEGEEFGMTAIRRALGRRFRDARETVTALIEEVDRHAAGHPDDDLTIVALRR